MTDCKGRLRRDMNMDMGSRGPVLAPPADLSNQTVAAEFLDAILNDDQLKIIGNRYAQYFWYAIAAFVAIALIANVVRRTTLWMRLRAAAQKKERTARPQNLFTRSVATATAMAREVSYLQFTPTRRLLWLRIPPMGTIFMVLLHFALILGLEFANNSVTGPTFWQARGVRAGWLTITQIPLLILLVGKNNVFTILTGVSYERLNVLHRWTARIMLFTAVLHFGYQSYGWQRYGLMQLEWSTDDCPPTGIAAFVLLLWINISTLAPIRNWCYEFFVIQHLITFFGFVIAVMYHLPDTALESRYYVYVPIGLYLVDRLVRLGAFLVHNYALERASLTPLIGDVVKIRLPKKTIANWAPGSFVLLSIPRFGWIESHPATIMSTPRSHNGDLIFILKSHEGFTKRLMTGANDSSTALLPHTKQEKDARSNVQVASHLAFTNGPYGGSQADFAAFDSVCLISGSTGVTFTLALLQSLAERATLGGKSLPLKVVKFVWCVRDSNWASWVNDEIVASREKLEGASIEVDISVYVTCADAFTEEGSVPKECGCACDKSLGPCCCVRVDADATTSEDEDIVESAGKTGEQITPRSGTVTTVSSSNATGAISLRVLSRAAFYSGRPKIRMMLSDLLDGANGESGIAVCGPIGLSSEVRNTVVSLSDERAIHKGTQAQGCYLHVESFS